MGLKMREIELYDFYLWIYAGYLKNPDLKLQPLTWDRTPSNEIGKNYANT